jgi:hypothetical protein
VGDIDLLVEVGLGIHRRLEETEPKVKIARRELSFWYLANHLGKRFLRDVIELTGSVEPVSPGLWRGRILGRPLWLMSNRDLPIDDESAPVCLVSEKSVEQIRELAKVVISKDEWWRLYSPWIADLFPEFLKELQTMATKRKKKGDLDLMANVKFVLREVDPEGKMNLELMTEILTNSDPNLLVTALAALSKEKREMVLQEVNRADTPKHPAAGS